MNDYTDGQPAKAEHLSSLTPVWVEIDGKRVAGRLIGFTVSRETIRYHVQENEKTTHTVDVSKLTHRKG